MSTPPAIQLSPYLDRLRNGDTTGLVTGVPISKTFQAEYNRRYPLGIRALSTGMEFYIGYERPDRPDVFMLFGPLTVEEKHDDVDTGETFYILRHNTGIPFKTREVSLSRVPTYVASAPLTTPVRSLLPDAAWESLEDAMTAEDRELAKYGYASEAQIRRVERALGAAAGRDMSMPGETGATADAGASAVYSRAAAPAPLATAAARAASLRSVPTATRGQSVAEYLNGIGHVVHPLAGLAGFLPSAAAQRQVAKVLACAKLVALDFDQTTLRIHAFGEGWRSVDVFDARGGAQSEHFASLEVFPALLQSMRAGRVEVFFASFGVRDVIASFIATVAPWFPLDHILTPSSVGGVDGRSLPNKNDMLALAMSRGGVPADERSAVILIDDDARNVIAAQREGYQGFATNAATGMTDAEWDRLSCTARPGAAAAAPPAPPTVRPSYSAADLEDVELGGGRRRQRGANAWVQQASARFHELRSLGANVTYKQVLQELGRARSGGAL